MAERCTEVCDRSRRWSDCMPSDRKCDYHPLSRMEIDGVYYCHLGPYHLGSGYFTMARGVRRECQSSNLSPDI